jgi:hypothetical protein
MVILMQILELIRGDRGSEGLPERPDVPEEVVKPEKLSAPVGPGT